jgi:HEAT repeat protein
LKQLQALAADEAPTVRQEAIWALSGLSEGLADDARAAVESVAFDAKKHGRAERFEALQGLARVESDPDHERLAAVALKDEDALMRIMAARSLALRGDARSLPALVALLDVKSASADGVAEEEAVFERRTADVVLSELAGVAPGSRSSADWRKALPDVAARLCAGRPDRPPQRLAQFW